MGRNVTGDAFCRYIAGLLRPGTTRAARVAMFAVSGPRNPPQAKPATYDLRRTRCFGPHEVAGRGASRRYRNRSLGVAQRTGWIVRSSAWAAIGLCVGCAEPDVQLEHPIGLSPRRVHAPPTVAESAETAETPEARSAEQEAGAVVASSDESVGVRGFSLCDLPDTSSEGALFSTNSAALRPRGKHLVDHLADCLLRGELRRESIVVVGYADPRGSEEYNQDLGLLRARSVQRRLSWRGVPRARVRVVSVGESRARGWGPESWQLDRRIEIRLEGDADAGLSASDRGRDDRESEPAMSTPLEQ